MKNKFTIVVDTREQKPWKFMETDYCNGVVTSALKTGDYTLKGLEDWFVIERKFSPQELYQNICTADTERFERELVRLQEIPHSYIICAFTLSDIKKFPWSSSLSMPIKKKIGAKGEYYLRRFIEITTQYRVPIILAGTDAQAVACSIFKRVFTLYHERNNNTNS